MAERSNVARHSNAHAETGDGYETAPEEAEGPRELRHAPLPADDAQRARAHSLLADKPGAKAGAAPHDALAHSWHGGPPALFSGISFLGPADQAELFGSPRGRISAWLTKRSDELTPADAQRDRDLMFLLLENRSFGYPGTDGTLLSNYVAYVLNRHPLISILTAHPLHPFTRAERLVVLTCSFCWAFLVKAMMHREPFVDTPWYVFYTVLALLVLPYEVLIRVFAVCPCFQYPTSESADRRRRAWLCCGRLVLATLTLFNIAFLSYGVYVTVSIHRVRPYSLLRQSWSTIVLKSWALLVWFPTWLPIFLLFYNSHKQAWLDAHPPAHPCHVCATSTEDGGVSVLYWLLVTGAPRTPLGPRVSRRFSRGAVRTLPVIDTAARTLRMPSETRAHAEDPHVLELAARRAREADAGGGGRWRRLFAWPWAADGRTADVRGARTSAHKRERAAGASDSAEGRPSVQNGHVLGAPRAVRQATPGSEMV